MTIADISAPAVNLETPNADITSPEFVLVASCPDQVGIIHAMSEFLSTRGYNIREHQQFDDVANGRVYIRTAFQAHSPVALEDLEADFAPVAERFSMSFTIHDSKLPRVIVMVSKSGHCLNDLLFRWRSGELHAEIAMVVSNHNDLRSMAEAAGLPFVYLPVEPSTKYLAEHRLLELVEEHDIDLVVLARYMQIFSDDTAAALSGKAINIHHSFLPGFKGARPYHQAKARGVKMIGATAHYVTGDLDEGPIIEQEVIRVNHTFDARALSQVGQTAECQALSRAVQWHCEHRVLLSEGSTIVFR